MNGFMKKPCQHCPFRIDVTPFLHPERGAEIAYSTDNPFNSFACHKTTESDDETGESFAGEESKECAGFLTLRAQSTGEWPEGFEPSWDLIYTGPEEMAEAYENE